MQGFGMFLSRLMIGVIFLFSAVGKIMGPSGTVEHMKGAGIPAAGVLLIGAIAFELIGGLFFILGLKTRFAGILLLAFMIPTTLIFHFDFTDKMQTIQFMKNLSIMGGILALTIQGPGGWSIDNKR